MGKFYDDASKLLGYVGGKENEYPKMYVVDTPLDNSVWLTTCFFIARYEVKCGDSDNLDP